VDPEAAALGARHALGDGMWDTAESLGRAAIAAGDIGAVTILAQAVAAQGRTDEADALLTDALPQAEGPTADRIRLAQAMNSRWFLGDSRRAVRIVQEMQEAGGPAGVDARLLRARFDLYDADFGAALATAGAVLESEPEGSPRSLSARAVVIPALASLGRSEQAVAQAAPVMRDLALGGFAAYARVGRAYWGEELMQGIFRALTLHGSFDQAERLADFWLGQATSRHCLGQGEGRGGLTRAALWKVLGAEVKLLRGRAADALDLLHDAELRGPGPSTGLIAQLTATAQTRILAAALLQTGRPDAALSMLDAVDDVTARTPSTIGLWIGDGAGLALASHGRTSAGLDRVRAELARARAAGAWAIVLRGLHEIARTGPSVQLERYELAMLDRADGPLARARAGFVRAASARDAAGLEAAGRQFADLGAYLYAAEAAAAAMRVHDAAARYAEARYAAATARSWLEKCDVATSPLTSMLREPLQLTDRQREIARLAASGLASKVIAKRLVLSVRTVDNYLGQVYRKLGINNRQELSKIMGLE
jgi:DNA-binding CsgD family transcriptional regulator